MRFVFILILIAIPSITIARIEPEAARIGLGLAILTTLFVFAKGMSRGPLLLAVAALEATKGLGTTKSVAINPISFNIGMRRIVIMTTVSTVVFGPIITDMPRSVAAVLLETRLANKRPAAYVTIERRHIAKDSREMRVIAIVDEIFGCTHITTKLAAKPKIQVATKFSKYDESACRSRFLLRGWCWCWF
jgi:hypothetical protein